MNIRKIKSLTTIDILVTFLVYNFVLCDNMFEKGFNSLGNLTRHIICPLMFVNDFILFDMHHKLKWYDALLCTILPLIYVFFIFIRSAFLSSSYEV